MSRAFARASSTIRSASRWARAREIAGSGEAEQERVHAEIRRLRALEAEMRAEYRAFLSAALERLDGAPDRALEEPGEGRHQAA